MQKDKAIEVLNSLIEINNDRIEGFKTATEETSEVDLKTMFSQFIQTSQRCIAELIPAINLLGGTPSESTRTTGKIYRLWMDVKATITGKERVGILNSCSFGEEVALDTYRNIITEHENHFSADIMDIITAQELLIRHDHEQLQSIRDLIIYNKTHIHL